MNKKKYENITADDVWAMFADTDRRMKEMSERVDKLLAESAKRTADAAAVLAADAAEAAERSKRLDEKIDKICGKVGGVDEDVEERERRIKKLEELIGGIGENVGHHAEQFFQDSLAESLTFGGEKYDYIQTNFQRGNKNGSMEFDIVLINGKSVAVIEVKNRIHPKFVKELAGERLAKFRELFPEYQKHKVYLGIAGFSFSEAVREKAREYGIGIIKQVGKSLEIEDKKLKAY